MFILFASRLLPQKKTPAHLSALLIAFVIASAIASFIIPNVHCAASTVGHGSSTSAFTLQQNPDSLAMPRVVYGRVWFSDGFSRNDAEEVGVEIEHGFLKGNTYAEAYFNEWTLDTLRRRGVRVDILIDDAEARNRAEIALRALKPERRAEVASPANFRLGAMGGFYTLEQIYGEFQRMRTMFSQLVSEPMKIGESHEQRPLYVYRFGTAQAAASNKPEVLYTALHHAREPGSASNLIYFLWNLLERFAAGEPEAVYLLTNRQLFVVPVVNPDGYVFNQTRNPQGGGLWRKNRRENGGGAFGVDLNRNYGTMEFWDAPNNGSSLATGSDTYRGPAPFSEPETQAIRSLCSVRNFKTALNYHTFSNLLIYPYSYINRETPDSTYFRALCADITRTNKYSAGRDIQTVGYAVRGASDDWMYADVDGHTKIMAMTPEVGSVNDQFWPAPARIAEHGAENLPTNTQTAWSAETNLRPVQVFTTEDPTTGRSRINVEVQNIGVAQARDEYTLALRALTAGVEILAPQRTIKRLRTTEVQREVFALQTDSMISNGSWIPVEITILQEGVPRRDTVRVQVYLPNNVPLFSGNDGNASGWTLGRWGVVYDRQLGQYILTDSPQGAYRNNDRNFMQYSQPISLRGLRAATLEFYTRWSLEANFDFAVVQVSTDGGNSWRYLQSSMMKSGQGQRGAQPVEGFGLDGNFPLWIRQECSLNEFLGSDVLLRFGVLTDFDGTFDGWLLSSIVLRRYLDSPTFVRVPQHRVEELRIVPNVLFSEEHITLALPAAFTTPQVTVRMYNMLGQLVLERSLDVFDNVATLRNPFLPRGIYVVVVSSGNTVARQNMLVGRE